MKDPERYRRHLPHIQPFDGTFFVTFMLAGALPKVVIIQMREEQEEADKLMERKFDEGEMQTIRKATRREKYRGKYDHLLDGSSSGPVWLGRADIAKIVMDSIHFLDGNGFRVIAYCIMSNHVHLIADSTQERLFRILQKLKRHTSRQANKLLNLTGTPFWQEESFDHLIRSEAWLGQKIQYTLNNPVKARMVIHWSEWPYSYIHPEFLHFAP